MDREVLNSQVEKREKGVPGKGNSQCKVTGRKEPSMPGGSGGLADGTGSEGKGVGGGLLLWMGGSPETTKGPGWQLDQSTHKGLGCLGPLRP